MSSNQIKTTWCNDVRSKNSISHVNQQTFCDSFQRKFPVKRVGNKLFNWYEFPNIPKLPIFGRQLQWPTKKSVCRMHQSSHSTPTFVIVLTITLMVFTANIVLLPQTVMAGCYFQGSSEKLKLYSTGNSGRRRFSGRIFFRFFYFWGIMSLWTPAP